MTIKIPPLPPAERYPLPLLDPPADADALGLVAAAARNAVEDRLVYVLRAIGTNEHERELKVRELTQIDDTLVALYHDRIRLAMWLEQ